MIAIHNNHPVRILDVFVAGAKRLAAVVAIDGSQPYTGGHTYPVRTQYATVPADELGLLVEGAPACDLIACAIS